MDTIAVLDASERADLFRETAARRAVAFQIIEKDFWVCWTLKQLFELPDIGSHLIFKGGTSLSKIFNAIERFSEDIDVSIARDYLGFGGEDDPENISGTNKRNRQLESLQDACKEKIQDDLLPALTESFTKLLGNPGEADSDTGWRLTIDEADLQTLLFTYPRDKASRALPGENYIKPVVRIELGARADHFPAEMYPIKPYAAEEFPAYFEEPEYTLKVLAAERTFWEKATILHDQAHKDDDKATGDRISRHYYDLFKLLQTEIVDSAINDLELLQRVVNHKNVFFRRAGARYEECLEGKLMLIPSEHKKAALSKDYEKMQEMFFGDIPSFDEIFKLLDELEKRINEKVAAHVFEPE